MPNEERVPKPGARELSDEPRRTLALAFAALRNNDQTLGAVERIVADYCRARHREGADPAAVIIEVKRVARSTLSDNHAHFDRIISTCIRHYFGDVEHTRLRA